MVVHVNVNDCWLLQKLIVYHKYKFSSEKKKKKRSPSIWFLTPKPVRIRQSGRTGIGGVTGTFSGRADDLLLGEILPVIHLRDSPATWSTSIHSVG